MTAENMNGQPDHESERMPSEPELEPQHNEPDTLVAHGIVVGVDGSEHAECALKWGIDEALASGKPLELLTAYSVPVFAAAGLDGGFATIDDEELSRGAQAVLREASDEANAAGLSTVEHLGSGDATGALVAASETADLIVVGSRGRGGFIGRLLGSVSSALPGHAKCPVVVVPASCAERFSDSLDNPEPETPAADIEPVVCVGVDGSDQARFATLVAAEYASRHHLTLRVLCAIPPYTVAATWAPSAIDRDAVTAEVATQLQAGKAWLEHHFPNCQVETSVVDGNPIEKLIDATKRSRLVVIGTRGHGGFAGMLLGSTSDGVLHHTKGPLMVVLDRDDPRLADRAEFGPVLRNV